VKVVGNYAFLANNNDGVRVYDVSNPADPKAFGHTITNYGGYADGLAVFGNYLYLANYNDGLRIYPARAAAEHVAFQFEQSPGSWPTPLVPGFQLQQCSDLLGGPWTDVTNSPVTVSNRNQIVLPTSAAKGFFRIRS